MQEGGSEEWRVGKGEGIDGEVGDIDKNTEGHQSPKDVDEEDTAEIKWPCSVCEMNVTDDGLKCVECSLWSHVDCTEVIDPKEYKSKPFKCPKCAEKCAPKTIKAKDSTTEKKKTWQTTSKESKYQKKYRGSRFP